MKAKTLIKICVHTDIKTTAVSLLPWLIFDFVGSSDGSDALFSALGLTPPNFDLVIVRRCDEHLIIFGIECD